MPTDLQYEAHAGELEAVVASVFDTMLGLDAICTVEPMPRDADMLTSAVYLTGQFRGAVLIHAMPHVCCALAGRFLDLPPEREVSDDVRDVMGELANMVAGNLKCTFLPGTHLSMPTVMEGSVSTLRVGGGKPLSRTDFSTSAGLFWVSMVIETDL